VRLTFRMAAMAAGTAGLVATSLLTGSAIANAANPHGRAATAAGGAARLPISAAQMLADRRAHDGSAAATGAITGSAQAANGQPLEGVCVSAYGLSGHAFAATQADGRFLLAGLKPGAYQLRYSGCADTSQYLSQWYGGAAERTAARSVMVSASALRPLAPVTMRTLAGGSPTADVIDPASPATTAKSLRVALGLPAYGSAARPLPAATVAATGGGRISGVVRDPAGHGLSGICVDAVSESSFAASFVHTGKGGRYETTRLPAGTYFVAFYADCGNTGNWLAQAYDNATLANPTPVRVHRGKTTSDIDATLRLGGEISGTVTNASGAKLSGICVEPVSTSNNSSALFFSTISERGTYHIRGLPAGPYKIIYDPCAASAAYASIWWPHAATEQAARTIRLKQRQVLGRVNEVIPIGGVISGTVTNSSSAAIAGICVFASPTGPNSEVLPAMQVTTNAKGKYEIIGLSPAGYSIQFTTGCGNNGNYLAVNYPSTVTVTYGQTRAGIDIQLPTGATVSGTVRSASTSKPVAGICVSLTSSSANGDVNVFGVTNTAGAYDLEQIPTGTYYVEFSGGCGNTGSYSPQAYDNANEFLPQPIAVTAGQNVTGIDAAMQPGATIAGTVKSQAGRGLSGICVFASSLSNQGQGTSKDGRYTVANLLPGQYQVSFVSGCGSNADLATVSFGSQSNPPVVSAPPGTTSGIDAVLPVAGNVGGQILTRSGRHVAACVAVIPTAVLTSGQPFSIAEVQQVGSYEYTNLRSGTYVVNFDPGCFSPSTYASQWYKDRPSLAGAARVRVRAGHTLTGISSALVKGGSITGRVITGGKPVNGVCVYAQSTDQFLNFAQTTTNKAGQYNLTGLNSGRYEMEFYPCDEGSATLAETLLPRLVTVRAPRATTGVNAAMALGGDISGTVLGGSPATAQPDLCVEAEETSGLAVNTGTTGTNGEFTITNLPAGNYQVDIGGCGVVSNVAPQWYQDAPTSAHATVVPVSGGKVTALASVTLSTNGAVTGIVTGPNHAALAGVCATASSPLLAQPVVAVSGASGAYSLLGLAPGNYRIEFSSGCGASGYRTQWWKDKKSAATATTVTVTAATSTTGINATMQR
jgi:hypothetical protein